VRKIIYDIPTSHHFKWQLGRTGLSGTFKRANSYITAIFQSLKSLETLRSVASITAISRMRRVRRDCYSATATFMYGISQHETDKIDALRDALSSRIDVVASHLLGQHKNRDLAEFNARAEFENFYDDVKVRIAGRKLGHSYRFERATSQHFASGTTNAWLNSGTNLGLNEWINTTQKWEKEDCTGVVPPEPDGVRYLTPMQREGYRITFRGGMAYDANGGVLHTGSLVSSSAGRGWAIYVVGFDGQFYWGEHNVNIFHHSSFFAGAPVLAGGEIAINAGRVVGVTNKTGHYKAGSQELSTVLQNLTLRRVDVAGIAVQDPILAPHSWFRGDDALRADGVLTAITGGMIAKPTVPE
jgi:hypothetical protein